MSMEIDPDDIEAGNLSFAEAKYLQDRGRLPADYEMPTNPKDGEEPEPPSRTNRVPSLEEQQKPSIQAKGGIVDDGEEEDYEEGWNNDQRRAALSERGLSLDGNKAELLGRLRRSDLNELQDDDVFEA